jgi:hypothetical protein
MKISERLCASLLLQACTLSGCYVIPERDGQYSIYLPAPAHAQPAPPRMLHARLYPENDLATQTGMVSGTVTNMMTGKGRFNITYAGETLTGEATRVSGDDRKGIASAYGPSGAFMSCEYQMNSPAQGAGTCMFSNGARYKVHIGN